MATISPTLSLTTSITAIRPLANGDVALDFQLVDAGGVARSFKEYILRADGSGVYDNSTTPATQVVAVTPAAWLTAVSNVIAQANAALTVAAAAGKVQL